MPTVARIDGFRIYFYSHEPGEPPHVHVDRAGASAKLWLVPVTIAGSIGFSARDLGEVLRMVRTHQTDFVEAWHGFFGTGSGG